METQKRLRQAERELRKRNNELDRLERSLVLSEKAMRAKEDRIVELEDHVEMLSKALENEVHEISKETELLYERKMKRYKQQLLESDATITDLNHYVEELTEELKVRERELDDVIANQRGGGLDEEEIAKFENRLRKYKRQLKESDATIEELTLQLEELSDFVKEKDDQVRELTRHVEDSEKELDDAHAEMEELRREADDLQAALEDKEYDLKKARASGGANGHDAGVEKELRLDLQEAEDAIAHLKSQVKELKRDKKARAAAADSTSREREDMDRLLDELDSKDAEMAVLQEELSQALKDAKRGGGGGEAAEEELRVVREELADTRKQLSAANEDVEMLVSRLDAVEAELEAKSGAAGDMARLRDVEEELEIEKEESNRLRTNVAQLEDELRALDERREDLARVEEMDADLRELAMQLSELSDDLAVKCDAVGRSESKAASLQAQVQRLETSLIEVRVELDENTGKLKAADEEYAHVQQMVEEAETDIDALTERVHTLEDDLSAKDDLVHELERELADAKEEAGGGSAEDKRRIDWLEDELESAKEDSERMRNKVRDAEDRAADLEERVTKLQRMLDENETEIDKLTDRCEELEAEVSEAERSGGSGGGGGGGGGSAAESAEAKQMIEQLEKELDDRDEQLARLHEELELSQHDIAALDEQLEENMAQLREVLEADSDTTIQILAKQLDKLKAQLKKKTKEFKQQAVVVRTQDADLDEMTARVEELESELGKRGDADAEELEALREENEEMRAKLDEGGHEDLEEMLAELEMREEKMKERIDELEQEAKKEKEKAKQASRDTRMATEELALSKQKVLQVREQLRDKDDALRKKERELSKVKDDLSRIQRKLEGEVSSDKDSAADAKVGPQLKTLPMMLRRFVKRQVSENALLEMKLKRSQAELDSISEEVQNMENGGSGAGADMGGSSNGDKSTPASRLASASKAMMMWPSAKKVIQANQLKAIVELKKKLQDVEARLAERDAKIQLMEKISKEPANISRFSSRSVSFNASARKKGGGGGGSSGGGGGGGSAASSGSRLRSTSLVFDPKRKLKTPRGDPDEKQSNYHVFNFAVTGEALVGRQLKATGQFMFCTEADCGWAWSRSADGENFAEVPDATSPTYQPTPDDVGCLLRVVCSYKPPQSKGGVKKGLSQATAYSKQIRIDSDTKSTIAQMVDENKGDFTVRERDNEDAGEVQLHASSTKLELVRGGETLYAGTYPKTFEIVVSSKEGNRSFAVRIKPAVSFGFLAETAYERDLIVMTLRRLRG